jgi:hypothetical protein
LNAVLIAGTMVGKFKKVQNKKPLHLSAGIVSS